VITNKVLGANLDCVLPLYPEIQQDELAHHQRERRPVPEMNISAYEDDIEDAVIH
jgi:hypothetical protein